MNHTASLLRNCCNETPYSSNFVIASGQKIKTTTKASVGRVLK